MRRALVLGALVGAALAIAAAVPGAQASSRKSAPDEGGIGKQEYRTSAYRPSAAKRRRARRPVQVYIDKRGGYSYSVSDTFNTFSGDARDPMLMLNRQTPAGPFDNGFFFDSPVAPRGGQSPYMN
jgi:hypothetical protein